MKNGDRDNAGRFRPGMPSANPRGRPKKKRGIDAAIIDALNERVTVTEQGQRRRRTKLEVTAAQIANKGAGGDLPSAKLVLAEVRRAEERAEADTARAPVMTEADHVIVARVVARLRRIIVAEGEANARDNT